MSAKSKSNRKPVSFDEYKSIKDEIIEISEQRFENILTRRLKEFKKELMNDLAPKFDAIDSRFDAIDSKFEAVDSKFETVDSRFDAIESKFDSRFDAVDSKFVAMDSRFDSIEKRLTFITWFLPFILTAVMAALKYVG